MMTKRLSTSASLFLLPFMVLSTFSSFARCASVEEELKMWESEADAIITTASKKKQKASNAPATVIVVTQNDILLRGYSSLKDVLRDLPGLETVEYYFSEVGTLVPTRGISGNNKIVVLVNGMRVNPPGGEEMMLREDFSVREAEQIEVIYGPGSTLYGQDAISAVINVITRKPQESRSIRLGALGGTKNLWEGWGAAAHKRDGLALNAYAQYHTSGLTDFSRDYPGWWENYRAVAAAVGAKTTPSRHDRGINAFGRVEGQNSSVQVWYRESSRSSAEGGYTPTLQFVDEARWHDRSMVAEARNQHSFSETSNLESSLTYNKYEIHPESRYVFPVGTTTFFYDDFKYGVGTGMTLEEKFSSDVHERLWLTVGAVVSHFDIVPKATVPSGANPTRDIASQAGRFTYYTQLGVASSKVEVQRANTLIYENYGFYLETNYRIADNLTAIAGGRLDKNTRFQNIPFSPRAAMLYEPGDNVTLKYIFTKAFVAPPPYFGYNVFDNGSSLNTVNEDLRPETAASHEVNAVYAHKNVNVSASLYLSQQDNLLIVGDRALPVNTVQNVVYLDLAGTQTRRLTRSANAGASRSVGLDLYARWTIGTVSLWNSYSYVDTETDIAGLKTGLDKISRHNARTGATVTPWKDIFVTASLSYRSTPENLGNTYGLGYETENPYSVNLHALYSGWRRASFFLDVRNLTNHKYALKGLSGVTPQETFRAALGFHISL